MTDERNLYVVISANGAGYRQAMLDASRETRDFGAEVEAANAKTDQFGRSLDGASGHVQAFRREVDATHKSMGLLAASAIMLGPAFIPLAVSAVPTIAGLTAGVGALAGATGTAYLAFKGVGGALTALNTYQAAPTKSNLKALQTQMQDLGPAGADFVRTLNRIEPSIRSLQTAARQGLMPGLEQSIIDLMPHMNGVKSFVTTMSTELGRLAAKGTHEITTDPEWQAFFKYVQRDGPIMLDAFAKSVGNVAKGVGGLMSALSGTSLGFDARMEKEAQKFADWSAGLAHNQGFQGFLNYVHTEGPKAAEALKAVGDALIDILHAASPWGTALLPVITDFANVVGAIADSKIGPTLFDMVAAFALLDRLGMTSGMFKAFNEFGPAVKAASAEAQAAWKATAAVAQDSAAVQAEAVAKTTAAVTDGVAAQTAALEEQVTATEAAAVQMSQAQAKLATWQTSLGITPAVPMGTTAAEMPAAATEAAVVQEARSRSMLGRLGAATSAAYTSISPAAASALRGIGGPVGVGLLIDGSTRSSGGSAGVVEDMAGGALAGFSMGGAPGALIGAAGGGLFGLVTAIKHTQQAAQSAASDVTAYAAALDKSGHANTDAIRQLVIGDLNKAGVVATGRSLGLTDYQLGQAGSGQDQGAVLAKIHAAMKHDEAMIGAANANMLTGEGGGEGAGNDPQLKAYQNQLAALQALAKALGDTTTQTANAITVDRQRLTVTQAFSDAVKGLPSKAVLALETPGLTPTTNAVIKLLNTYKATPTKIQTVLAAMNVPMTLQQINSVLATLHQVPAAKHVTIVPTLDGAALAQAQAALAAVAPIGVLGLPLHKAGGGYITGPGTGTSDSIHAMVSNGEFVVNAGATAKHRGLLEAINGHHFANGGYVGYDSKRYATPVNAGQTVVHHHHNGIQPGTPIVLQVDGQQLRGYVDGRAHLVAVAAADSDAAGRSTSARMNW